jgi:1,4-alpha-glucan branching enzyme
VREWDHESVLDWGLHDADGHVGVRRLVTRLNELYRGEPALHRLDSNPEGFRWIEAHDDQRSVFAWIRLAPDHRPVVVVANATPSVHHHYRIGVPRPGGWEVLVNTDAAEFGGSGVTPFGESTGETAPVDSQGQYQSLLLTVPPLAVLVLAPVG